MGEYGRCGHNADCACGAPLDDYPYSAGDYTPEHGAYGGPTDAEGLPVRPDGRRYAMTEPHPFVLTPNVAARGRVCHLRNGAPDYGAHWPNSDDQDDRYGFDAAEFDR